MTDPIKELRELVAWNDGPKKGPHDHYDYTMSVKFDRACVRALRVLCDGGHVLGAIKAARAANFADRAGITNWQAQQATRAVLSYLAEAVLKEGEE